MDGAAFHRGSSPAVGTRVKNYIFYDILRRRLQHVAGHDAAPPADTEKPPITHLFPVTPLTAAASFAIVFCTTCCNTSLWREYDRLVLSGGAALLRPLTPWKILQLAGRSVFGMSLATRCQAFPKQLLLRQRSACGGCTGRRSRSSCEARRGRFGAPGPTTCISTGNPEDRATFLVLSS